MRPMLQGLAAIVVLAAALSTASGAPAATVSNAPNPKGEAKLAKLLEGRVAGKPVSCINLHGSDSSQVIDGTAIVYSGPGGRYYVNRPRGGADSLRDDDVLLTRTIGAQLCKTDPVTLIDSLSRFQRGFVQLGDFVPYAKPKP